MGKFERSMIVAVACLVLAVGCTGSAEPDAQAGTAGAGALTAAASAVEAVSAMLQVAEAGDWEQYVDKYYGEQEKFQSTADRDKLVARFRDSWGSQVVEGLRRASTVKPTLSEDGQSASFPIDGDEFRLYLDAAGKWTFHL